MYELHPVLHESSAADIRDVLSRILTFFHSGSPDPNIPVLHPGSYIKRGMKVKTTFFHASYSFRKKSLKPKR
jgi:hypothetical protein